MRYNLTGLPKSRQTEEPLGQLLQAAELQICGCLLKHNVAQVSAYWNFPKSNGTLLWTT